MLNTTARAQLIALQALALAYLGRAQDAVSRGNEALTTAVPTSGEYAYILFLLARIHLLGGAPESAVQRLEQLVKTSFYVTPGWLRIDPTFDALHGNLRFERLVGAPPN